MTSNRNYLSGYIYSVVEVFHNTELISTCPKPRRHAYRQKRKTVLTACFSRTRSRFWSWNRYYMPAIDQSKTGIDSNSWAGTHHGSSWNEISTNARVTCRLVHHSQWRNRFKSHHFQYTSLDVRQLWFVGQWWQTVTWYNCINLVPHLALDFASFFGSSQQDNGPHQLCRRRFRTGNQQVTNYVLQLITVEFRSLAINVVPNWSRNTCSATLEEKKWLLIASSETETWRRSRSDWIRR